MLGYSAAFYPFVGGEGYEFNLSFNCNVCVGQGENSTSFLFFLYIKDLKDYLLDENAAGLSTTTEEIEKELFFLIFKNVYPVLCRWHCYFS